MAGASGANVPRKCCVAQCTADSDAQIRAAPGRGAPFVALASSHRQKVMVSITLAISRSTPPIWRRDRPNQCCAARPVCASGARKLSRCIQMIKRMNYRSPVADGSCCRSGDDKG